MIAVQVTDENLKAVVRFDPVPVNLHLGTLSTVNNELTFSGMKHLRSVVPAVERSARPVSQYGYIHLMAAKPLNDFSTPSMDVVR